MKSREIENRLNTIDQLSIVDWKSPSIAIGSEIDGQIDMQNYGRVDHIRFDIRTRAVANYFDEQK